MKNFPLMFIICFLQCLFFILCSMIETKVQSLRPVRQRNGFLYQDLRHNIDNYHIAKEQLALLLHYDVTPCKSTFALIETLSHYVSSMTSWMSWCSVSPLDAPVRHRRKTVVTDMCYPTQISSLMDFGTPDCSLGKGMARLSEICAVAMVTAGGVCSDTHWWL